MIEFHSNKKTDLKFKLDISGSEKAPEARFSIDSGGVLTHSIKAKVVGNEAIVSVPPLDSLDLKKNTTIPAFLEVIVDGNYFVPWKDSFVLKESLKVSANILVKEEEEVEETPESEEILNGVSVSLSAPIVEHEEEEEEIVEEKIEETKPEPKPEPKKELPKPIEEEEEIPEPTPEPKPKIKPKVKEGKDLLKDFLTSEKGADDFLKD